MFTQLLITLGRPRTVTQPTWIVKKTCDFSCFLASMPLNWFRHQYLFIRWNNSLATEKASVILDSHKRNSHCQWLGHMCVDPVFMQVARFAVPEHETFSLSKTIARATEMPNCSLPVMQGVSSQQNAHVHPQQHQPPNLAPAVGLHAAWGISAHPAKYVTILNYLW